ncbi:MAG: hypothetical protein F6K04_01010 [Leptolyngbya sp. SIO4C5]|nr:hypothetical protein [Leptolyngbya sp. SIO4C5]
MTWHTYKLDEIAQRLVLQAHQQSKDPLNQSYKMRTTVAFGLERFWGEHIRLLSKAEEKTKKIKKTEERNAKKAKTEEFNQGLYWYNTWEAFADLMGEAHIFLPRGFNPTPKSREIESIAQQFWGGMPIKHGKSETKLTLEDRRIAQAVLTQLCDSLVWWTQRYKDLDSK